MATYTDSDMDTKALIASIEAEIARLQSARDLQAESSIAAPGRKPRRPKGSKNNSSKPATKTAGKRTLSTEARAKIAAAQRARWAATKKAK